MRRFPRYGTRFGNPADAAMAALTVFALCCGVWLLRDGAETHAPPQPPSAAEAGAGRDGRDGQDGHDGRADRAGQDGRDGPAGQYGRAGERPAVAAPPPSPPDLIRIPAIRVNAPLTGLGLAKTGGLDVPPAERKNLAGWYEAGTTPGERGTAIVAGHVDNAEGPAVFYRLGSLPKGATIEVDRRNGTVAVFTVDAHAAPGTRGTSSSSRI